MNWHTKRLNYISNLFSVLLKLYKHNYSEYLCNYLIYNTLKMHTYTNFSVKKKLALLFFYCGLTRVTSIFGCTNTMIQNTGSELCEFTWSILPWKCRQTSNLKTSLAPLFFIVNWQDLPLFLIVQPDDPECSELCELTWSILPWECIQTSKKV